VKKQQGRYVCGFLPVLLPVLLGLILLAVSVIAGDKDAPVHPQLSEQEMLIDCAECHRNTTPDIEKEWFDSEHGIAMVKCYQCHGTFESFMVTPTVQTCATCHADMLKKCPQDKSCWECHTPHTFKAKN
jgi:hypothetical protein